MAERIKKISPNTTVAYIPGEGSETGELSDAYFWKNNMYLWIVQKACTFRKSGSP